MDDLGAEYPAGVETSVVLSPVELQAEFISLAALFHTEANTREARRAITLGELQQSVISHAKTDQLDPEMMLRGIRAETALELQLSERMTGTLMNLGHQVNTMPRLRQAWLDGLITRMHAEAITETVTALRSTAPDQPEVAARVEDELSRYAMHNPPHLLRAKARRMLETVQADTSIIRHQEATRNRCVTLNPAADSMTWLSVFLPAVDAAAAYDRTRQIAHTLKQAEGETRHIGQLQTDALRDLLIHGTTGYETNTGSEQRALPGTSVVSPTINRGIGTGIRANVTVTVPALALLAHHTGNHLPSTDPAAFAELDGYGPIDIETATRLAGTSPAWRRILTHPASGIRLAYDRQTYRPPEPLRNYVQAQDHTCRFPGCNRPAKHCELDHTVNWHWDGPTDANNLASLCRSHHVLKHNSNWQVKHIGDRILKWTSPTGTSHITTPRFHEPPHPPDPSTAPF